MDKWKVPLFRIYWDDEDVKAVTETIKRGMSWTEGPNVEQFERALSQYLGVKYCVTFNSGTSATHAILWAYGIGQGDEVIVPSFTFISTAHAPLFVNARPILADIEENTYGLDPDDVKKKITKQTKAILPIHYGGCPCLIEKLREVAQEYSLVLIEDAAEALGANIRGKKVATFGDAGILSFCQNKMITTGEGGAVVTNSGEIYERLKLVRSHGRLASSHYFSTPGSTDYVSMGYNFRMSDINAALGVSQLSKIDKIIELRRSAVERMNQKLAHIPEVITPTSPEGFYHVYQMYTIRVKNAFRDNLMKYLGERGIMTKIYFSPAHLSYFDRNELKYNLKLPVTQSVSNQVLTLPMYPTLTEGEMDYIANEIASFFS